MTVNDFLERVRMQFNLMPDKDDEHEIVSQIGSGVSFRGANLWVLIFAIFIASLGLNVNSTAVIIQGDDKSLSQIDGQKLHDWLRTRIKADSIVVIKKD